jgi:hypothetical protein
MTEDPAHDSTVSWKRVSALEETRADPMLDTTPSSAGPAEVPTTRLAVCPYCRSVWELESIFPEPVKLMICWRCASEHARLGLHAPGKPVTDEVRAEAGKVRWKLAGGYALLVAVGLALGYIASHFWFDESSPARATSGPNLGVPAAVTDTGNTDPAGSQEAVLDPPSAGPMPGAAAVVPATVQPAMEQAARAAPARPDAVDRLQPSPPSEAAPARAVRPNPTTRRRVEPTAPAEAPPREVACTQGAAALGLCSAVTTDGRP